MELPDTENTHARTDRHWNEAHNSLSLLLYPFSLFSSLISFLSLILSYLSLTYSLTLSLSVSASVYGFIFTGNRLALIHSKLYIFIYCNQNRIFI